MKDCKNCVNYDHIAKKDRYGNIIKKEWFCDVTEPFPAYTESGDCPFWDPAPEAVQ